MYIFFNTNSQQVGIRNYFQQYKRYFTFSRSIIKLFIERKKLLPTIVRYGAVTVVKYFLCAPYNTYIYIL